MKIDRRNFLALGFGATAGTVLSPLPWKLTDDSSIWTQNWSWTPVPKDGDAVFESTVCTLCPGNCGISVRKIDDRAVKIEGQDDYPINNGGACILGISGLQLLYGPSRIETPMRKVNGKWQKTSWEDALKLVSDKLGSLRDQGKSNSLACISGAKTGTTDALFERFLKVYGSSNMVRVPSITDSYKLVMSLMNGVEADAGFDVANAGFVLSFGSGMLDGWGSPVHMFQANSALKDSKAKVVQIESRLSNTAAVADKWIPVKPGTQTDLAYGIAGVIISESLYNREFVENHSRGFEQFKSEILAKYSLDTVSLATGIKKDAIITIAREFAKADKPLALCGYGQGRIPGSIGEFAAVHALNALVGNLNKEGGVWAIPKSEYLQFPAVVMDDAANIGFNKNRIDGAGEKYPLAKSLLNRLPEVINGSGASPVEVLFVTEANPVYTMADTAAVKKAFEKIPFVVSFSSFMDETAQSADLILPNHTYLERSGDVLSSPGITKRVIGMTKPVVAPLADTKNSGDFLILLAQSLAGSIGESFAWEDYDSCLESVMGEKWEALSEDGFWSDPDFKPAPWGEAFGTISGKFEFICEKINSDDQFAKVSFEGDPASFPLMLIPADSMRLAGGDTADPSFAMKAVSDEVLKGNDIRVEINPETAKKIGLTDGGYAVITTPVGKAKVKTFLFEGIMPGVIGMPTGLGHTTRDMYISGKGISFNQIIRPVTDPVSGLDAATGIMAKIAKA